MLKELTNGHKYFICLLYLIYLTGLNGFKHIHIKNPFKINAIQESDMNLAYAMASSIINESSDTNFILNNVNIKQASQSEFLSVSSLRVSVFYPEYITNGAFHKRILEKLRSRKAEGGVCLVAIEKEVLTAPRPAGYNYVHILGTVEFSSADFKNTSIEYIGSPRKLYIMDLAIRKSARRLGLASLLLNKIEEYAINHSYDELYLHVETENEAARTLYEKFNYEDITSYPWTKDFTTKRLHKPPESYVFLRKILPNHKL